MTHHNRHDPGPRHSEPGILSNVFSFVSREIGEFVINATGAAESGPSKPKHRRDGKWQHGEKEERGRQRKGYYGSMIEQWREVSGSVEGGGEKRTEKTKDRRKSSTDSRGRSRREKERRDGKKRASSGSPARSQSAECTYSHTQSQSREPSRSRTKKTKARSSSDGKQAKSRSTDGYGRKKCLDRPEDADGELTPSVTSRSQSPRRNSHSRGGKARPQEETTSTGHPPQDPSSSRPNHSSSSNLQSISSLPSLAYPLLRKKPSITMPGSLFPRSDSLEPEPNDEEMETRRVRFLSASEDTHTHERNPNPIPRTPSALDTQESEPGSSNSQNATPADRTGPSPWRTRPIASVHDAVQRFTASGGEERDFSLLVVASPAVPVDPESPGDILERLHSPLGGVSRKGKERAVDDGDEDLAFILDNHRVQDKEKQLDAARRETGVKSKTTNNGDRGKDKERIRILEEEVRMLKEELSRRRRSPPPSHTQTQVPMPPPPPPPPLPPPPGVRIPLLPHLGESGALFASARAALRPTEASTTVSTNDVARSASGKMRQPTVNVPSDKMAAFLNEMRTVRLRKVGSIPGGLNRSVSDRPAGDRPGPSGLSRSVSTAGAEGRREVDAGRRKSMGVKVPVGSVASSLVPGSSKPNSNGSKPASTSRIPSTSSIPKPTFTSTVPKSSSANPAPSSNTIGTRINNKRKADVLGDSEGGSTSKRRSGTRAQAQSDTSTSSSSSSKAHEFSSGSTRSIFSLTGPSLANHSSLSNETDITTPSLCSDNGGDADGRMPSTPPGPRSAVAQSRHDEIIEIIDVDMEDIEPAHKPITPSRPQGDMFRKRPPMSPLPVPTPRKLRAPARAKGKKSLPTPERTKRGATPKPKSLMLLDEDDDDDEEEDEDELAFPPKLKWRREPQPRVTGNLATRDTAANGKGKRRLTLDEELARARSSDRLVELGLESGELMGTGTGSTRRGFLSGGGAGGVPVFMGVGYVRGVEDDGLSQPVSRIPRRRG